MPVTRKITGSPAVRHRMLEYALVALVLVTAAVAFWLFRH
jgi:hypothetical protein